MTNVRLAEISKLKFGQYFDADVWFEVEAWSRFLSWNLIKIYARTCDMIWWEKKLVWWKNSSWVTQPLGPLCLLLFFVLLWSFNRLAFITPTPHVAGVTKKGEHTQGFIQQFLTLWDMHQNVARAHRDKKVSLHVSFRFWFKLENNEIWCSSDKYANCASMESH